MAKYLSRSLTHEVEAVRILAVDFIAPDQWPDGSPFDDAPNWLIDAIRLKLVRPIGVDADYAMWDVYTLDGYRRVGPDDYIVKVGDRLDILRS